MTALEDKTVKGNPLDHRLVRMLLPEYLDEIDKAEARRGELDAAIKGKSGDEDSDDETDVEDGLTPVEVAALKKESSVAKKRAKTLEQAFVAELAEARSLLSSEDEQRLVLSVARSELTDHLDIYVERHRMLVALSLENWWEKYAVPLSEIEAARDNAAKVLTGFLEELGYARF